MGLSRQEHWSGLPFPPPGDLPDLGRESTSMSPALAGGFFTTAPSGKPPCDHYNAPLEKNIRHITLFLFFKKIIFIYLAEAGLSCGTQNP